MFFDDKNKQALTKILRAAGSADIAVASQAQAELAKAVDLPIRETLLSGDIVSGIYTPADYTDPFSRIEYPTDMLTPGQEREFYAYVIPGHGAIPHRMVESDYLMVPTYEIGNSIDCHARYIENANWNVLTRMLQIYEAGFVKKMNDDGWQTLLAAGIDRNILVSDPNATAGQFTPRLVTLLKTFMRRNGGGNSATPNRARVSDIFVSPEAQDDIRAWNIELIPDEIRARIFDSADGSGDLINVYGVNITALDEFGEGQEYQTYFTGTLGGTMAATDLEVCLAIDKNHQDSFVNPWRKQPQTFEDNTNHRRRLFSLYGWGEMGWAVLDSRRLMFGSF